jgi:hypothetical protein
MFFWMFDVSPLIAKLVGPRPKVIWHAEFGNTSLALVDACDHMPIMRRYRWLLCAGYRQDLREIIGDFSSWPEAQAAWQQWSAYLAKSGTVAAWKEHSARQRQSEVY